MSQAEIKKEVAEILERVRQASDEIREARAQLVEVQGRCKHPKKYRASRDGEPYMYCPDCHWEG